MTPGDADVRYIRDNHVIHNLNTKTKTKTKTKMTRRYLIDLLALFLHTGTVLAVVILEATGNDFLDSATGVSLLLMEAFTLIFHIYYVLPVGRGTPGEPRASKWIEYGISATLGTIAVLLVDRSPRWDWILFVGFVGGAQQTIGLLIDTKQSLGFKVLRWAFLAGCLIQLGEYIFVGWHTKLDATFAVYVVFYSLFGFHAARGLLNKGGDPEDFMEEVYSLFGFTAKLTLFWSKYFDENQIIISFASTLSLIGTLAVTWLLYNAAKAEAKQNRNSRDIFERVDGGSDIFEIVGGGSDSTRLLRVVVPI